MHKGSCHCGKVTFSILHSPKLSVSECNCSICYMKGSAPLSSAATLIPIPTLPLPPSFRCYPYSPTLFRCYPIPLPPYPLPPPPSPQTPLTEPPRLPRPNHPRLRSSIPIGPRASHRIHLQHRHRQTLVLQNLRNLTTDYSTKLSGRL